MNVFPSTVAAAATPVLTHPTAAAPMMIMMPQMMAPAPAMVPAPAPVAQHPMMVDASSFIQYLQAQQQKSTPAAAPTPAVDTAAVEETVKSALSASPVAPTVAVDSVESAELAAPLMPWEEGFSGNFPEASLPSNSERKAKILARKLVRVEEKMKLAKKPVGRPAAVKLVKSANTVEKKTSTAHPTSLSSVSRVHLNGRGVVFAGDLKNVSTIAAQALARKAGAIPLGMVNLKMAKFLVAGRGSKDAQVQAAKYGVRLIDVDTFMRSCKK